MVTVFGRKAMLLGVLLLCVVSVFNVQPVLAQSNTDIQSQLDRGRPSANKIPNAVQGELSERQAVARARSQFAGNVLRISLVGEGNNKRYQIRMEKDGKVFTLFVHARTGKITRGG